MKTILIGSPIRQKPNILSKFLQGLEEADRTDLEISYFFVDDNTEEKSSELLRSFTERNRAVLVKGEELVSKETDSDYICDRSSHYWKTENIDRITRFKDSIIEYCIEKKFDYLFLVDSDIVLAKKTLVHLVSREVEIVSNVFWTQWQVNGPLSPQCFWIPDLYQQNVSINEKLSVEKANEVRKAMNSQLKVPGIYPVDGLGACTMIARSALEKGVRFKAIPNLSVPGEDRHFCIRAGALGIALYMDTVFPVYHIFREEYLSRVDEFREKGFSFDMCQTFDERAENAKNGEKAPSGKGGRLIRKIRRCASNIKKRFF